MSNNDYDNDDTACASQSTWPLFVARVVAVGGGYVLGRIAYAYGLAKTLLRSENRHLADQVLAAVDRR